MGVYNDETHILLFDGVCNLCNTAVIAVIKRDRKGKFKFASLQSQRGQALLNQFGLSMNDLNTVIYINNTGYFIKSSAVLHVLKELGGIWKLFYVFIILPKPLRDFLYSIIAKTRYKIFGKRASCIIPPTNIEQRFLQ